MANINIFKNDAFSLTTLTSFVNKKPYVPSFLKDMKLFSIIPHLISVKQNNKASFE